MRTVSRLAVMFSYCICCITNTLFSAGPMQIKMFFCQAVTSFPHIEPLFYRQYYPYPLSHLGCKKWYKYHSLYYNLLVKISAKPSQKMLKCERQNLQNECMSYILMLYIFYTHIMFLKSYIQEVLELEPLLVYHADFQVSYNKSGLHNVLKLLPPESFGT